MMNKGSQKFNFAITLLTFLLSSQSAIGENGLNVMGVGTESRGMGGTGVANYTSPLAAIYKNPALLSQMESGPNLGTETELSFLYVNNSLKGADTAADIAKHARMVDGFAPNVAIAAKYDNNINLGFAMLFNSAVSVNQPLNSELNKLKLAYSMAKLMPSASYKMNEHFAIGFSPVIAMGSLEINTRAVLDSASDQSNRGPSEHFGYGFQFGFHGVSKKLSYGFSYTSPIRMTYDNVSDIDDFNLAPDGILDDLGLDAPKEWAAGLAYKLNEKFTLAMDYRRIFWDKAATFSELSWDTQDIFNLGIQYKFGRFSLRAGWNHATDQIKNRSNVDGTRKIWLANKQVVESTANLFNVIGLPGINKNHYTMGFGFELPDNLDLDLAFTYSPSERLEQGGVGAAGAYNYVADLRSWSASAGLTHWY